MDAVEEPPAKRKRVAAKKVDYCDNFDEKEFISDYQPVVEKKSKKIKVAKI